MTTTIGRPPKLLSLAPEFADAIVNAVRSGAAWKEASAAGHVHPTTLRGWLERGQAERDRLSSQPEGTEPFDTERPFLDFLARVEEARQECRSRMLQSVTRSGEGEDVEESHVTEKLDQQGNVIERTVVVRKRRVKSWQAAAWWLERNFPEDYAQVRRTEVTGLDGAPLQVETIDAKRRRAQSLAEDELGRRRRLKELGGGLSDEVREAIAMGAAMPWL